MRFIVFIVCFLLTCTDLLAGTDVQLPDASRTDWIPVQQTWGGGDATRGSITVDMILALIDADDIDGLAAAVSGNADVIASFKDAATVISAIDSYLGGTGWRADLEAAVALNTAKVGITTAQALAIETNTAKVSYPGDQSAAGVPFTPEGSISATNVQAAIQEVRDEAGSGSGDMLKSVYDINDDDLIDDAAIAAAIARDSEITAAIAALTADDIADGETYAIPTLTQETNWDAAYGWGDHAGIYSLLSHNHDSSYAALTGATFTGAVSAPSFESSASDGEHYANFYNSIAPTFTPSAGDVYLDSSFVFQIYNGSSWAPLSAGTDDQNAGEVPFTTYLTITSANVQAAIEELKDEVDAVSVGSGYVAAPTYSDDTCTTGQRSFDASYIYICESINSWDRYPVTFANWSNPTPVTYDLTMAITDTTGTGSTFTVNSESATVADTPKTWTGLSSATEAVTFTPDSTETSACTGTGVTGSDPNWVVDMSSADVTDMACTVSAASAGVLIGHDTEEAAAVSTSAATKLLYYQEAYPTPYGQEAVASGTATEIVYYHNSGSPSNVWGYIANSSGTVIAKGSTASPTAGWVTITLESGVAITSGNYYTVSVGGDDATMYVRGNTTRPGTAVRVTTSTNVDITNVTSVAEADAEGGGPLSIYVQ